MEVAQLVRQPGESLAMLIFLQQNVCVEELQYTNSFFTYCSKLAKHFELCKAVNNFIST